MKPQIPPELVDLQDLLVRRTLTRGRLGVTTGERARADLARELQEIHLSISRLARQ